MPILTLGQKKSLFFCPHLFLGSDWSRVLRRLTVDWVTSRPIHPFLVVWEKKNWTLTGITPPFLEKLRSGVIWFDRHQKGQKSQTQVELEDGKKITFSEVFRYATKRLGFNTVSFFLFQLRSKFWSCIKRQNFTIRWASCRKFSWYCTAPNVHHLWVNGWQFGDSWKVCSVR